MIAGTSRDTSAPRQRSRTILRVLIIACAYVLAARFCLGLPRLAEPLTPVWIPSAIALASVLRWGPWMLIGVFAGDVASSLIGQIGAPLALGTAAGDTLEAAAAALLITRLGGAAPWSQLRDVAALVVAALFATMLSASIGVSLYVAAGDIAPADAAQAWLLYWSSTATAILLLTPLLLRVRLPRRWSTAHWRPTIEAAGLAALLAGASWIALLNTTPKPVYLFLLFPLFTVATLRFGMTGASGSVAAVAALGVWGTLREGTRLAGLDAEDSAQLLQALVAVVSLGNITLAAALQERDQAHRQLSGAVDTFAHAQTIAAVGSWELARSRAGDATARIECSAELMRLFGLSEPCCTIEQLVERVPVASEGDHAERERLRDAITTGLPFDLEHKVIAAQGHIRTVRHVAAEAPAPEDGSTRLVAAAVDITDRKSVERLKDALVATASHELRTPLTSILGFTSTLTNRWDDVHDEQRLEFIAIVQEQAGRLAQIVDDTLMQSRVDARSLLSRHEAFAVAPVIDRAATIVDIDVDVECSSAVRAVGDTLQFERVLTNLLANAKAYGEAPFAVRASADAARVEVQVIDSGPGIVDDFAPHLFDRFTRGPSSVESSGTGLGLSISRGLMEAAGGSLDYERRADQTVFVIRIQAADDAADAPASV